MINRKMLTVTIFLGLVVVGLFAFFRSQVRNSATVTSTAPSPTINNNEKTPVITLHYNERSPYLITEQDGVMGLTGTPARSAFRKANIPFKWEKTPSKRQIVLLKENDGLHCLPGWFSNVERQKFAKITNAIYQDQPQIALARMDNEKLSRIVSVDTILADKTIILAVKDGYSYGSYLDAKISHHKPKMDKTTAENINMLKKVHMGRNDYFFIAPEEAAGLIESSGLPMSDFRWIRFNDMEEGETRHILCSRNVRDDVIERLNKAIGESNRVL